MIKIDWNKQKQCTEAIIDCHCEEELRYDFKALIGALTQDFDVFTIFLEEVNDISQQIQEELIKNGKNNSSDES